MAQSEFSNPFRPTQSGLRLKISESLLSRLKSNHYWMALGSRKWVENTDMQIKYKTFPELKAL